ncbi:MAG TPA: hypothetical protein VNN20_03095 [Thermodesulfobacteriota bacterium]|nr:hypothetical protein [Thermodesulfobacteriota bacterium]
MEIESTSRKVWVHRIRKELTSSRTLIFSFFIFILIYNLYYFNSFLVPDTDFFDFREKAISFTNLTLPNKPESYQRLPFYSVLMGFLSIFLPVREPILFAAEFINLVSSIASILLIYLISHRFIGKSAFFVALLFAFHPLTTHMTIQPRAEMLTLMLILSGFWLSFEDKYSSYLCGFLAAITRYEGVVFIVSLLIKDVIFSKRRFLIVLLCLFSALGIIAWVVLNYRASGHINPYHNYHGDEIGRNLAGELSSAAIPYIKLKLAGLLNFIPSGFLVREVLGTLALTLGAIGFYSFFKKSFRNTLLLFLFLIGHLTIHFIFYALAEQHFFLISWICYLAIAGGIIYIAKSMQKTLLKSPISHHLRYGSPTKPRFYILVFVLMTASLLLSSLSTMDSHTFGFWILYILPSILALWFVIISYDSQIPKNRLLIIVLLPVLSFILGKNILLTQERMENAAYTKSELRLVGEWLSLNINDGEKIVVTVPRVAGYYYNLMIASRDIAVNRKVPVSGPYVDNHGNFLSLGSFNASSYESFISELKSRGVTYVVWNSHHGKYPQDYYYYKANKIHLISELGDGRDKSNFKLIKTIRVGPNYAFIYKFVPEPDKVVE